MLHPNRISSIFVVLTMAALACLSPAITPQASDAVSTAVAQTVIAGYVQEALSMTSSAVVPEPTLTFTPEPVIFSPTPTSTPTHTLTATLAFTPTLLVPQISVSVPTNCRVGPGRVYRMVGAILVGETAQVYGRDPTGRYWYIRNPDANPEFCWAWGEYATVTGNTALLPVYTPAPTPTPTFTPTPAPDFEAVYDGLETCTGWWVEIELQNTGTVPFESIELTVRDTVTEVVLTSFEDGFTNNNGCSNVNTRDTLDVGRTRVVSAPVFNYDPTGHRIRARITLCSDSDLEGICVARTINFTP